MVGCPICIGQKYSMLLSIIIPTLNRQNYLVEAINSVLDQSLPPENYEIIVVDNGSSDNTRQVIQNLNKENLNRIRYFHEKKSGLHNARHKGLKEARGEILVFADDDIIAAPLWLEMILENFKSKDVALVGGKILPRWEGKIPDWIDLFKNYTKYGWTIGYLSLLDFGDKAKIIPGKYVFGCNFSIRKKILFECGGFHPDAMPEELIKYRGDGETALANTVQAKGYKIMYEPTALIYHRVPPERLTIEYFCRRAFNQGVSESFSEIRLQHGLSSHCRLHPSIQSYNFLKRMKQFGSRLLANKTSSHNAIHPIRQKVAEAREAGKAFHQRQVNQDKNLLDYVLQKTYF